ncbi:MAG TPA: Hsp20 family protein [candidate division Zixibacteria bacterium]|nr:Hsp20 family protein [candidate division Zixibacteria bacterium]MDM7972180.1 Hsp20 family protein [candidate division Zixibacteria bacterium]HPM36519.1 Hsp20 family protein [candidate division Zixibacteria bacterium]
MRGGVRREIATGTFKRQYTLPSAIDQHSVKAEYKNGFLRLTQAKREEAKPKQIDVKVP